VVRDHQVNVCLLHELSGCVHEYLWLLIQWCALRYLRSGVSVERRKCVKEVGGLVRRWWRWRVVVLVVDWWWRGLVVRIRDADWSI
jgi:hypothetical protein